MVLPLPVNAPAELSEWVATLGQHWDEQQRVRFLGMHSGSGQVTLRILASSATGQVRVHQQVSATYGAADHTEDLDCRPNRQQQVTLDIVDGQYVWLIPLWDDQGTLRAFDGVTGPDQMTLVDLLTLDGAGSGLDADLLDGEEGLFYQDAANLISGILADARLSANVPLLDVNNTFTGAVQTIDASTPRLALDHEAAGQSQIRFNREGELRWIVVLDDDDDDGDNDGGGLRFAARDDGGGALGDALTLERASLNATIGGNVTVNGGIATVGNGGGAPVVLIDGSAGNNRVIRYLTGGVRRWEVVAYQNAEGGGNTGSDYRIARMDDAGNFLSFPIMIERDTGFVELGHGIKHPLIVGDGLGVAQMSIDGAAGQNRGLILRTAGDLRWFMYEDTGTESGSNAGSNLRLSRYSDAGSYLGDVLRIIRSTGTVEFKDDVQFEASLTQDWNINHDVEITIRGASGAPGSGNEFGARLRFGTGVEPPYIAGIQLGGDPDTQGLVFYTHPSATSATPPVKALQLGPSNNAIFYGKIDGSGGTLVVDNSLTVENSLTVNNDVIVVDVFNAQGRANLAGSGSILHFFQDAGGGATKQTVTGSSNTTKINSLIAALDAYGLIDDNTT